MAAFAGEGGEILGVLGGGQLGRMMAEAAHNLGVRIAVLDPKGDASPAGQLTRDAFKGDFKDEATVKRFCKESGCKVLTVEIEHVNVDALAALEAEGVDVQPAPETIRIIQDKFRQKEHIKATGGPELKLGPYAAVETPADVEAFAAEHGGFPVVLKARMGAYDGKGNYVVKDAGADLAAGWEALGGAKLYVEAFVPFTKEIAVMVARDRSGTLVSYPVVHTIQKDNICHTVIAPTAMSAASEAAARRCAEAAIATFPGAGIFGVELFLLEDGGVLLNEIAPRPHNSGHYTIEACATNQFEQHVRAVLGWPLGDPSLVVGASVMVNILGTGDMASTMGACRQALTCDGATMHWYGKDAAKKGRKMAHITAVGRDAASLRAAVEPIMGSDAALVNSDVATLEAAAAAAGGESKSGGADDDDAAAGRATKAALNADWKAVQARNGGTRVDRATFVAYLLEKHRGEYDDASKADFETFLNAAFDASTALMLPAQKTDLGGHCFRYGALMAGEFYHAQAKNMAAGPGGCGCDTPVADVLRLTK
eukprot:g4137.t1